MIFGKIYPTQSRYIATKKMWYWLTREKAFILYTIQIPIAVSTSAINCGDRVLRGASRELKTFFTWKKAKGPDTSSSVLEV